MSTYNLDKIFEPAGVAVVGASEKPGSIGRAIVENLRDGGYQGSIFPVNPHHSSILGLQAYPSVSEIGDSPDLAVIATPIQTVPPIVRECGQAGVGGAVVISAGGKETGEKGREIEEEIRREARAGKVRIIGPNCLGIVTSAKGLNASFASHMPLTGNLAFVSQSGAICTAILDFSLRENIRFSHFVSIGSMLDVDFGDLVNYLGNDPRVSSIVLYIESLTHFRKFMSAARAVSRMKPVVVLKAGRSPAGAKAATSHTGAMAGEDDVYDAAFQRAGIVRVDTILQLFDCAELMAKQPPPKGPKLGIVTNAGGPGVMAVDALSTYGLEPASLFDETLGRLNEVLPPYWSRGNPVDILGDASPERYRKAVEICASAKEMDALLITLAPQALTDPTSVAQSLADNLKQQRLSVFTCWMGGGDVEKGRRIFNEAGIPTYETPERAIKAFWYMYSYGRNLEMLQEIPPRLPHTLKFDHEKARGIIEEGLERDSPLLTEYEAKNVLQAYGIPVNRTEMAGSAEEAVRLAEDMGYPVALKVLSPDITHKSDAHGVQLNLHHPDAVREAFKQIEAGARDYDPDARFWGATVQPMLECPDYELIIGAKKDKDFGPVILFGMGGIMTEILKDRAIALPPLNRLLARRLIESTRIHKLLKGYRNRPPADLMLLEEILIRLSQLVTDFADIAELDMNPVILSGGKAFAVDARILLRPSDVPSPMHLVISPYPNEQETTTVTAGGVEILIRPIKPEDAPLLVELFNTLSPQSIYHRFMRPLKSLPHYMLARFTQIDYDREVSLVAIQEDGTEEKMLGVARVMSDPDGNEAEFAILVGDPWQGKGIGAELLEHSFHLAEERGIKRITGRVLLGNVHMLELGRKLGFTIERVPGASEYELSLDLNQS